MRGIGYRRQVLSPAPHPWFAGEVGLDGLTDKSDSNWTRGVAAGMRQNIFLGRRHGYAGSTQPYHFPVEALGRHCEVLGKTGMGKTTLLQAVLFSLIEQGGGVGLIDPHGDLAESVLAAIPKERIQDVIYLDAGDPQFAPALNLVSSSLPEETRDRVASALLSAFRHIWSESWGPRLEYLLYHAIRLLLDSENSSLVALPRIFTDDRFRDRLVKQCRDPFVRRFWEVEYESWDRRFRSEAISPVLNKLGQFVSNPALRQVFGQVRLRVDFREVLDSRKILILNLSKGKLGDDASRLMGALVVSFLASQSMERAAVPESERTPFTLFIDEAQNFLTGALASILSESRKYALGLVLSHQYLDQLSFGLQGAVLGNVGSIFSFRVSAQDAETMEKEFGHNFPAHQFVELAPFTALVRPLEDSAFPFLLDVSPPPKHDLGFRKPIQARCRRQFGTLRTEVESKLARWLEGDRSQSAL
jgi:type IV secretory pathway TraG/TraD family ATPase VirD4